MIRELNYRQKADLLERIIIDTIWMAQRYADGRSTYATSIFNEALDDLYDYGILQRGSVPYATDGSFGEWDASIRRFRGNKNE